MNKSPLVCLAALLLAASAATAEPTNSLPRDELLFRNGDFIYGKLLAVTPNEILQWQHPDASTPINFTMDTVEEVEFGAAVKPPAETGGCKVLFSNGDLLRGKLVACDSEILTVDVPGAGRLKLPRQRLQSLAVTPTEPAIIDGLTGMDGWTEVSSPVGFGGEAGHWKYRNGAFYASRPASVARDLKLPDMARIEFDLAWRGQPNLAVAFYTDSLQPILLLNKENGPDFGGFYSFRLSGIVADIYPIKKHGIIPSLGSVILAAMDRTDHAHFDFRVSKPQNRIVLLIDKTPVMQWSDPNGFEGEGTGIRFVENSGAIKLSNLRVTRWDGILEEKPDVGASGTEDVVWLQNGQSISGVISSLNEQTVNLRAQGANQAIPFSTVRDINFMAPPTRLAADPPGVRAMFAEGGGIHAQLESWSPDGVVLRSPDFGRAKFNPSMFASLQFLRAEGN
jgi:hypothetical protein